MAIAWFSAWHSSRCLLWPPGTGVQAAGELLPLLRLAVPLLLLQLPLHRVCYQCV